MEVKEFFGNLKKHCRDFSMGNGEMCRQCKFRSFCFTPPINLSDDLVVQTQRLAEKDL